MKEVLNSLGWRWKAFTDIVRDRAGETQALQAFIHGSCDAEDFLDAYGIEPLMRLDCDNSKRLVMNIIASYPSCERTLIFMGKLREMMRKPNRKKRLPKNIMDWVPWVAEAIERDTDNLFQFSNEDIIRFFGRFPYESAVVPLLDATDCDIRRRGKALSKWRRSSGAEQGAQPEYVVMYELINPIREGVILSLEGIKAKTKYSGDRIKEFIEFERSRTKEVTIVLETDPPNTAPLTR
jgi:hypothetical protein